MKTITLLEVDPANPIHQLFLYELLARRKPEQNISHRQMPTWDEHIDFLETLPYQAWYLIQAGQRLVGAVYLTFACEIGIQLVPSAQGQGLGRQAVEELMKRHSCKEYLANIAPGNKQSQKFFERLGFRLIQYTYRHER